MKFFAGLDGAYVGSTVVNSLFGNDRVRPNRLFDAVVDGPAAAAVSKSGWAMESFPLMLALPALSGALMLMKLPEGDCGGGVDGASVTGGVILDPMKLVPMRSSPASGVKSRGSWGWALTTTSTSPEDSSSESSLIAKWRLERTSL